MFGLGQKVTFESLQFWLEVFFSRELSKNRAIQKPESLLEMKGEFFRQSWK